MIKIEDPVILERDALDEYNNPLPQKVTDERTIYLARNNYRELVKPTASVQITDFDLAVSGMSKHTSLIQVESYRAPEVILDARYTYSADIWNLGVILWDLLEGKRLFTPKNSHTSEYDNMLHLAQIIALLGPAPEHMLAASQRSSMFYNLDSTLHDPGFVS
ncbi:Protein kinase-like domain protein [Metarhizium rileyi]|uniref:Protein kinase-like domain protein n=1 Tax=Metarhizium rileyi (strain RCEF 4871) TaxID=1649241 RepID=A0A166VX80_METRR|nr:Protein kinase-like domain protein [Metarhizium rileyi RCEF 4871]